MATDKPTCSEPECRKDAGARGLCRMHYMRLWRDGSLELVRVKGSVCEIAGCGEPLEGFGYCSRHYQTFKRTGNPLPKHEWSLKDRVLDVGWDLTDAGCWEWRGARFAAGYGALTSKLHGLTDRTMRRISYELFVGPIPDGLIIRHKCDNRPCMNPDHLETGTRQDNSNDMMERRGHWTRWRLRCSGGHDLTSSGTHVGGRDPRLCTDCSDARQRARKTREQNV